MAVSRKGAIRLLLGFLIIAAMLCRFDPTEVLAALRSARPIFLVPTILVYACTFLILSLRWRMILSQMGVKLSISEAYMTFAGGMAISDLTPARIGEFSRPLLIRDQVDLNKGLASVAFDRYVDILAICLLGAIGIMLLAERSLYAIISIFIVFFLILVTSIFWINRPYIAKLLSRLGSRRLDGIVQNLDSALNEAVSARGLLAKALLITLVAWITQALRMVLIAKSLGYDVPIVMLFFLQPLASALSLVPLTLSGLGFVEGGLTILLVELGVPPAAGIAIALIDRALTMCFHIIIGGRYASKII